MKDIFRTLIARGALFFVLAGLGFQVLSSSQIAWASELPRVLWKAKVQDHNALSLAILGNGNLVVSRGNHAYEMYNPSGKSLLVYPGPRVEGIEARGITFLDDGSYVRVIAHTKDYIPGEPFLEMSLTSQSGELQWSQMLPGWAGKSGNLDIIEDGILFQTVRNVNNAREGYKQFTVLTCYDLDGKQLWTNEMEQQGEMYGTVRLENGDFLVPREGNIRRFDRQGKLLWEHMSYGVRRGFSSFADGSSYALLKAPERLTKVNAMGRVEWECNISKVAGAELNTYYEDGHAHGDYVTQADDGTVYVCDPYNAITAISNDGKHLWSVTEPEPLEGGGWEWNSFLSYNSHPSVAHDGTIYLHSKLDNLMAISPSGEVLFVDTRFADVSSSVLSGSDGNIYLGSAGWVYSLKPDEKALQLTLEEQEAVYEAERQREAEWEAEMEAERKLMEAEMARIEEEGGDPDSYYEDDHGWVPENPPIPGGAEVADRTVVASVIVGAMLDYYNDHGEFPPYLLGVKSEDDPLIAGGYLAGYPLVWPQPHYCGRREFSQNVDEGGYSRWSCAVSTPGAPTLTENDQYMHSPDYQSTTPKRKRQKCLSIGPGMHNSNAWSFFGYQRGEWLGRDMKEAWLWLYGSNIWPEQNNPILDTGEMQAEEYYDLFQDFGEFGRKGFDLLNGDTGELIPDGKRDGICLLYKLADGKLMEVIRADGI